jgi:hypothetical protein
MAHPVTSRDEHAQVSVYSGSMRCKSAGEEIRNIYIVHVNLTDMHVNDHRCGKHA